MPDISVTDDLGKPVETVKIDPSQPSSLVSYARSQLLHLMVAPDFVALQGTALSEAAAQPTEFQATLGNEFQLGMAQPEITLTPKVQAVLRADASHAGLEVTGSLGFGVSGAAGDFTFGLDARSSVTIGFDKAFSGAAVEPSLGGAVGQMLSGFAIAASVADLALLQAGDVCTVSGQGSLKLTGGFEIATLVNPLASVKLPLNAGSIDVKDGVMAGVSASIGISGAYQIRASGLAGDAIGLRFLKQKGATLRSDFTASASASVKFGNTDLLAALLGAIGKSGADPKLLEGLTEAEARTFNAALQEGVDHALQASLDLALSTAAEDEAVFAYEIQLGALDGASTAAVNRALHGDLTALSELESPAGVTLRSSILTRMRSQGVTLKVNLLGIVNLISVSKLIGKCEILSDVASGTVTIKETGKKKGAGAERAHPRHRRPVPPAGSAAQGDFRIGAGNHDVPRQRSGGDARTGLRESAFRDQSRHQRGDGAGLSQLVCGAESDGEGRGPGASGVHRRQDFYLPAAHGVGRRGLRESLLRGRQTAR